MFDRIKSFFRNVRIDLDFPRYERQQRDEHVRHAKRRFSTKQLYLEKVKLIKTIESEADSKFNASMHEKEKNKKKHEEAARETEHLLSFFLRHYKEELSDLFVEKEVLFLKKKGIYDDLSEIKSSLSEAFAEKSSAYSELNDYKDKIDSWYAKSDRTPLLFGNAGNKLPEHSLFGQSFGDLNSYKYHRDSAYKDVQAAKSKIGDLKKERHELHRSIVQVKEEIGDLFSQINQVKKDRSKMYELKKSGHQRKVLQKKLDELRNILSSLVGAIENILQSKKEFITQEKYRRGVVELEAKIRKLEAEKEQFLKSFDSEENKQNRKRAHREIWIKQRGVA